MKHFLRQVFLTIIITLCLGSSYAETVILYNDNGQGGIKQTRADVIIKDGQYVVNFPNPYSYGGDKIQQCPVERVKDSAKLFYNQPKWAEKFEYVIITNSGYYDTDRCYFNMNSRWIPSPTNGPNDPYWIEPIRKLTVYGVGYDGSRDSYSALLVRYDGKLYLYFGDDYFVSIIESNSTPDPIAPPASRAYKYKAEISGRKVYFNL